jgi:hypothetical protein
MSDQQPQSVAFTRRKVLAGSAALVLGGVVGRVAGAFAQAPKAEAPAPPLPWPWVKLDPLEAGRSAYHAYLEKGG